MVSLFCVVASVPGQYPDDDRIQLYECVCLIWIVGALLCNHVSVYVCCLPLIPIRLRLNAMFDQHQNLKFRYHATATSLDAFETPVGQREQCRDS